MFSFVRVAVAMGSLSSNRTITKKGLYHNDVASIQKGLIM